MDAGSEKIRNVSSQYLMTPPNHLLPYSNVYMHSNLLVYGLNRVQKPDFPFLLFSLSYWNTKVFFDILGPLLARYLPFYCQFITTKAFDNNREAKSSCVNGYGIFSCKSVTLTA